MFIVDLDELNFRELFEIFHERARDGIKRAIRLTIPHKIDMRDTIGKHKFAVTVETVQHQGESLVTFDIARAFEIFIERCANEILRGGDITRHGDFIRKLPGDQTVVICEVDIDLYIERRAGRQWSQRSSWGKTRCKGKCDGGCVGLGRCVRRR